MAKKVKISSTKKRLTQSKTEKYTREQEEANVPRGERANFLKVTITLPPDLLAALKNEGIMRRSNGLRDTDVSSLIRIACTKWLKEQ